MAILQQSDEVLVVKAGTRMLSETKLTLDRTHGIARVERATFLIPRRTEEVPLAEIEDIALRPEKDGASGAERYLPVIRLASGRVLALPPIDDKAEAEDTARQLRQFVGLH